MLALYDRALQFVISISLLVVISVPGAVPILAQPTVDGDVSDSEYLTVAPRETSNNSFGNARDVGEIVYYADDASSTLYIGVKGELPTSGNADGIALWLNFRALSGTASGTNLGVSGAGHYLDGDGSGNNLAFKADMEVDYMFVLNSGGGSSDVFVNAVDRVGSIENGFLGASTARLKYLYR